MKPIEILLLYNLITLSLITVLLILCKKVIRKDSTKDIILKSVSIAVVVIHYSSLYVDFFTNKGEAMIENNMILPVYPCNIVMWLLLIVSFMRDKKSSLFNMLAEFTFIGGTFCGLIGVLFNINFLKNPDIFNYDIFKGLISHSVMIFGTVYLYLFKYIKLEVVRTTKSIFCGLVIFSICGLLINLLFYLFGIDSVNAMFMLEPPIPSLPIFNFITIGILGVLLAFVGLNIYEHFALPKEQRWLTKFTIERKKQ